MAKKMLSVKVEEELKPILEKIADKQRRSQGGQIEYWIIKEAEELNIEIPEKKNDK